MANQMLIIFGIFADRANVDIEPRIKQADGAMAAFAFFLFVNYTVFGSMLSVFRNDIIKETDELVTADNGQSGHGGDDDNVDIPPEVC